MLILFEQPNETSDAYAVYMHLIESLCQFPSGRVLFVLDRPILYLYRILTLMAVHCVQHQSDSCIRSSPILTRALH